MIDGSMIKGKHIIIPCLLQKQILDQLHSNHMDIEKTYPCMRESVHWVNMGTELTVRQCSMYLEYQNTQPHEAALNYNTLCKPWEVVGTDIIMINNKNVICIVDYYNKFPDKNGKPISAGPSTGSQDDIHRVWTRKNCL